MRKLLLEKFSNIKIFNFDNVPANIFKGIKFGSTNTNQANSMRAAIMIAREQIGKTQITSLVRWRTSEREYLFKHVEKFLSEVPLTLDFFPKVSRDFQSLYLALLNSETLKSICTDRKTKFPLYVPSAPRYFIPALKKPAKRASQKVIYFNNEADRNYGYMVINSSLLYWWWRVRDGGMTISLETLMSLPLPKIEIDKKIIQTQDSKLTRQE